MSDDTLRTTYEWKLAENDPRRADCPAPEALLAVVDGTAREPERVRTLRHVGGCRSCQRELDLLRATHDTAEMAVHTRPRRFPLFAAAAAALIVVAGGVAVRETVMQPGDTVRDAAPFETLRLIGPGESAAAALPLTLSWSAVPDARRYEVEILSADGSAAFSGATQDTSLVVPVTTALAPGAEYRWWVSATLQDGSQARSLARTLRIAQ